ncbi:hypothetical protein CpecG_0774 [Chlamydia pecorum MC/MarsBar]|nr:hypothetical protein CpecG_0774 [Chlamydia pecorum MC/MarsBar]ETF40326.1 hypothetical protein CpecA_0776 [Chlamydia pecorum IPTaLE]
MISRFLLAIKEPFPVMVNHLLCYIFSKRIKISS